MSQPVLIVLLVVVGLAMVALLLGLQHFLKLWLVGWMSGAGVSFGQLISMTRRRIDTRTILYSRIRTVKAGRTVPVAELERHYLAGGRVPSVVTALIAADRAGLGLTWSELCEMDLAGQDVLDTVQALYDRSRQDGAVVGQRIEATDPAAS